MSSDLEMVAHAKANGLIVVGEVGRKFADGDDARLTEDTIDIDTTVREFTELLDAGAWKVYWEGHLLRQVLGDDPEMIKQHAATGTAPGPRSRRNRRRVQHHVRGLRAPAQG